MRRHMGAKRRVLLSAALFMALFLLFRDYAISVACPAVACSAPTGCFGACRSYVNIVPFAILVAAAVILPPVAFRLYRRL